MFIVDALVGAGGLATAFVGDEGIKRSDPPTNSSDPTFVNFIYVLRSYGAQMHSASLIVVTLRERLPRLRARIRHLPPWKFLPEKRQAEKLLE